MRETKNGSLLWIADLRVKEFLKKREIAQIEQTIMSYCGLSNEHIDGIVLEELRQEYYVLEEIKEEIFLAEKKRAEFLKKNPTQKYYSDYGACLCDDANENED